MNNRRSNIKTSSANWSNKPGIQKAVLTLPSWQAQWNAASPADFSTKEKHVHIWRIHKQRFLENWYKYLSLIMTKTEIEKARAIKMLKVKNQYLATRTATRCLLGEYLKMDPKSISFSKNRWGKPMVNSPIPLHFNLSHTDQWILLGVSFQRPIGVDVEQVRHAFDYRAMVEQYFHPEEQQQLTGNMAVQGRKFFQLWTRKEALAKAIGFGLHERLLATNMLEESMPDTQPGHNGGFFAIHSFEVDSNELGALALRNELGQPKFLNFP